MRGHYFDRQSPDEDDDLLKEQVRQGHVPATCLLGGQLVMELVAQGVDPCRGCRAPREKCFGRPRLISKDEKDREEKNKNP